MLPCNFPVVIYLYVCWSLATSARHCYEPSKATVNQVCLDKTIVSSGDVRILVLASIHESGPNNTCGQISPDVFHSVLAVKWIVDILNGQGNDSNMFIPGVRIGYEVHDDCGVAAFTSDAVGHAAPYVKPESLLSCASTCSQSDIPVIGAVAITSAEATSTARALLSTNIPLLTARAPAQNDADAAAIFSTVPYINEEYTAIVALLKQTKWNIIAILYSDDMLGQGMFQFFESELSGSGICIVYSSSLSIFDRSEEQERQFQDLYLALGPKQTQLENETLGVLYLGNPKLLASLLNYLSSSVKFPTSNKLQWLLPSFIAEDIAIHDAISRFTGDTVLLTLVPFQRTFSDFKSFTKVLFQNFEISPNHTSLSPWIDNYMEQVYDRGVSTIDSELFQHSHVYPVVKGILSLALAIKNRYSMICAKASGMLCSSMRKYLLTNGLASDLYAGSQSVALPPSLLPVFHGNVTLHQNSGSLRFSGDSILQIFYYDEKGAYTEFASYNSESLEISSWFPHAASRCGPSKNCSVCISDYRLQYAYIPGDILILGLFSVRDYAPHSDDSIFTCGEYRSTSISVMTISSFLHSIRSLNQMSNSKTTFGGVALDDCYSPFNATELLINLFTKQKTLNDPETGKRIDFDRVVAVVGALSSKVSLVVADLMTSLNIPMISYGASSAGLDDRVRYPYFLRTVPSDTLQVAGLVDLLKEMNFTHVGAVYIDDPYGLNGIRDFRKLAETNGICVEQEKSISEKSSAAEIQNIMDQISRELPSTIDNSVKAVVFYSIDTIAKKILTALKERDSSAKASVKFTFVASEAWGTNGKLITGELGDASSGSLVFVTNASFNVNDSFKSFLRNVTIVSSSDNPWLKQYLETVFSCDAEGSFVRTRKVCGRDVSLDDSTVNHIASDQRVVHVSHAVYAVVQGFKSVCLSECTYLRTHEHAYRFTSKIREVEMPNKSNGRQRLFTSEGNGFIGFKIYNIQREEGGANYVYTQVGSYSTDNKLILDKSKITLYKPGNPPLPMGRNWTASCSPTYDRCSKICPVTQTSPPPTTTIPPPSTQATPVMQWWIHIAYGFVVLVLIALNLLQYFCCLHCRHKNKNSHTSSGFTEHSGMNTRVSSRSNDMYDNPISQYSSIANLNTGHQNRSFQLEERAPSTSSGIVPGSSNVSNGTSHRLELPIEYSGLVAPEVHKYGSQMSVNSYLAPAKQEKASSTIRLSQDDTFLQKEHCHIFRSQSEGDVSDDKALTYMTAKDLQIEDEDVNYLDMSDRSQQTSPTSTGTTDPYARAPRRLLPPLVHVSNGLSQTSSVPRLQRPNTLPGLKAQIIPPENPPPYHFQRNYAPNRRVAASDSSPAYIQPTCNTLENSLSPHSEVVPAFTPYTYTGSAQALATGSEDILSPVNTLSRSRILPPIPMQHQAHGIRTHQLSPPLDVHTQAGGSYQISDIQDSSDTLGINFENNPNSDLFSCSSANSRQPRFSLIPTYLTTQGSSTPSQSPVKYSPIAGVNSTNSMPMIMLSQTEFPVMHAAPPPVHIDYTQHLDKSLHTSKHGHTLPTRVKEEDQSHPFVPLYQHSLSQFPLYQHNVGQSKLPLYKHTVGQLQLPVNTLYKDMARNNQTGDSPSVMPAVSEIQCDDEDEVMI